MGRSKTTLKTPTHSSTCPTRLRPRKSSRRPPWSRLPPAQPTAKTSPRPRRLAWLRRGLQCPDGRLPEVHGGVEGGGGLGSLLLLLLLAVATSANIPRRCLHSAVPPVQIFILTLICIYSIVPAFAIYMQTISNKYYVLT